MIAPNMLGNHRPTRASILRVVHVVPAAFGPDGLFGGAERYAYELARHMAAVTPTQLVTFGPKRRVEQHGLLTVRVLGRPWLVCGQSYNPIHAGLLRAIAAADVVHCHQ